MSVYEIIMLVCFGVAWPFSIVKSYLSQRNAGKSIIFLFIVLTGYVSGCFHKAFYSFDEVIFLYILNGLMVFADIMIYFRNKRLMKVEVSR